jgi:hypothetical protein
VTVFFGVAEALLQQLAARRIHLCGMLLRLKGEERVFRLPQEIGDVEIKLAEEAIGLAVVGVRLVGRQAPVEGAGVQSPSHQMIFHGMLLHITIEVGGLERRFDQFGPFGVFPLGYLTGPCAVFPEAGILDLTEQPGTRPATDQVGTGFPLILWPLAENQGSRRFQQFVGGKGPAVIEGGEGAVSGLVLLDGIQITAFQTEATTHDVKDDLAERRAMGSTEGGQPGVLGKEAVRGAEFVQAAITDVDQAELVKIGIVEPPAPAQIAEQTVTDDEAQCSLRFLPCQAHEFGVAQIFDQRGLVDLIKSQGFEYGIGQLFLVEQAAAVLQCADEAGT